MAGKQREEQGVWRLRQDDLKFEASYTVRL